MDPIKLKNFVPQKKPSRRDNLLNRKKKFAIYMTDKLISRIYKQFIHHKKRWPDWKIGERTIWTLFQGGNADSQ